MFLITEDEFKALEQTFSGAFLDPIRKRFVPLNEKELKLAGELLEMASDDFGRHCCNDGMDEWWIDWTVEERKAFYKEFEDYNSGGEDYDPERYEMQDYSTAAFLAYKLGFRRPPVPEIKKLLTNEQVRTNSQLIAQNNQHESVQFRGVFDGNNFILYKFVKADGINFKVNGWVRESVYNYDRKDGEYPYFVPERE